MSILWLLIKIALYIILFLLSLIIILTFIILISPVNYEIYFSKDENISYDIKIKYLKFIAGSFEIQDNIKRYQVKIMGKIVYLSEDYPKKQDGFKEHKVNLVNNAYQKDNKKYHTRKKHKNDILGEKSYDLKVSHKINEDNSLDTDKQIISSENKAQNKSEKYSNNKSKCLIDKDKKNKDKKNKDKKNKDKNIDFKEAMGGISGIKDITVCTLVFIKDLLIYISPKEYSFEIILGRDDPADTGELVAKLIMMYPFYYKHGIIRGDYEREGIRGGCLLQGKIRIGGIINLIIKFLLRTPVRTFLKNILYNKEG